MDSSLLISVLIITTVIFTVASSEASDLPRSEHQALLDLRSSLGIKARGWPRRSDPCEKWGGIRCDSGRVTGITLSGLRRNRWAVLEPRFVVDSIANLTMLAVFNSSGFLLPGSIPDLFGQRLSALQVLDLSSSSVNGTIPASLGDLKSLKVLRLSNNVISGTIPAAFGQLYGLEVLDLSMNQLTGLVPSELYYLRGLVSLDLSSNRFIGQVANAVRNFTELKFLNLSNNVFHSDVPVELYYLFKLVELDLSSNLFSGMLPKETQLASLRKMVIGKNLIGGSLTKEMLFSVLHLEILVLRNNRFQSSLPNILWTMPELQFLDVSGNQFTGAFPDFGSSLNASNKMFNLSWNKFFGLITLQLVNFKSIDLSGNYFKGDAPHSGVSNISFMKNCLQTANQRSLEECRFFYATIGADFDDFGNLSPSSSGKDKKLMFTLLGAFGGLFFFVLLVVVLWLIRRSCQKHGVGGTQSANIKQFSEGGTPVLPTKSGDISRVGKSFTYEQLFRSTSSFNEKYLIKHGHSGDLYRGLLESGTQITIKKVDLEKLKNESYISELKLFNTVSHPRLVPFLGHCLQQENEKFLVYKYFPNEDLSRSFYRKTTGIDGNLQSLDWITRLKIAAGAAEGLSYLHYECNPPLVHGDFKSSSIILDDKFEVRLGSLSEVHAQPESPPTSIPEFTNPEISESGLTGPSPTDCAYDVYCFGKVLLELVTGKFGMSDSDETTVKEWMEHTLPHISISDKEQITKIVDPSLLVDEDLQEEVWAMALMARSCLRPNPSKRPCMKHILKALENPCKVVRDGPRLRTTSSRKSWAAVFFSSSSWRQNSSTAFKGSGTSGSLNSSGHERQTSRKKLSSEIFPEPIEAWCLDAQYQD